MRVPEAKEAIEILFRNNPVKVAITKLDAILDAVWLTAYEEGEAGVFNSGPCVHYDGAGNRISCSEFERQAKQ